MRHQAGAHGIADYIADDSQKVAVMLNRKALEASLPHMATATIMLVVTSHMTGHPPLHKGSERIVGGGLQHEVEMVRHETEAEYFDYIGMFGHSE
jgi:hypothetical protein